MKEIEVVVELGTFWKPDGMDRTFEYFPLDVEKHTFYDAMDMAERDDDCGMSLRVTVRAPVGSTGYAGVAEALEMAAKRFRISSGEAADKLATGAEDG